jgi:serine/threonine protein kinase
MGEVWKARDRLLKRIVALKFLTAAPPGDEPSGSGRDLLREARAASVLNHTNIVTIFQIGQHEGGLFLAMELVEGETLRARLARGTPSLDEALNIAGQIVSGLAAAHAGGIVHRDLKPENVILRVDGCVKLVDFGLAKNLPWSEANATDGTIDQSSDGQLVGTFNYMSPEQARGKPVDARSDVFSVGIVLYELFTGVNPFRSETVLDTLNAITRSEAPTLSSQGRGVPPAVAGIVERALQKEPAQRFPSAVEMQEPLSRARSTGDDTLPQDEATARPIAPRWVQAVTAVLLLALALVTAWQWLRPSRADRSAQGVESIAVMSFEAQNADPRLVEFVDAMPADVGDALAAAGFRVASRSSVTALGERATAQGAGAELGVDAVLEGTVRGTGGATRLRLELVSVQTRFQIWSGTFPVGDGPVAGESPVAGDVANRIREALRRSP